LRAHLSGRIAAFKMPAEFRFVPALPRTATGKIQRRVVADAFSGAAR